MRSRCAPAASGCAKGERRGLGGGIERDVGALRVVVDGGGANVVLTALSVSRAVGSRTSISTTSTPAKREALEIGRQLDRVVDGNDRLRQLARCGVEGIDRLGARGA